MRGKRASREIRAASELLMCDVNRAHATHRGGVVKFKFIAASGHVDAKMNALDFSGWIAHDECTTDCIVLFVFRPDPRNDYGAVVERPVDRPESGYGA
jgi:hypothetical protein